MNKSNVAKKAWKTRKSNELKEKRSNAAKKAHVTRNRKSAAKKAWKTRREND